MNLFPELKKRYTKDNISAREAQRLAEFIAFGPAIFQTARIMVKKGILENIRNADNGLTIEEIAERAGLSEYAAKCLIEASLSIGLVLIDPETDRFKLSKTGWFLINDPATRVNIDFNHDVNYLGWFRLEESLEEGKPRGLETFGDWPTIYEGLSSLPEGVRQSWFAFDHFYSDNSFDRALEIVFDNQPSTLLDVGGNTGRWALKCVEYDKKVKVTVLDLPQQIKMMQENIRDRLGAERIEGLGINLLDKNSEMPSGAKFEAVWMSQFLDCFGENEIIDILSKAAKVMNSESRLYIMETLWDRQRFEPAALCLTLTSLYFTALANGNSKMYHSEDMERFISKAGLEIEAMHDFIGQGHSIIVCKIKK